jgi:hypothetical protein
MNESTQLWQRRVERITSRPAAADETWEPQTAELREGWSALSQLLEAADTDFDEQTMLVQVQARRHPKGRRWIGVAALAASLLLAVSALPIWSPSVQPPSRPLAPELANSPSQPTSSAALSVAPSSNSEFPWDDAWDEKLAQIDQSFVSLRSGSDLSDPSLQIASEHLQQLGRELNAEL